MDRAGIAHRRGLTAIAVVAAAAAMSTPILVGLLFTWTEWSGCFIECGQPNKPVAVLAATVTVLLVADVVACGVVTWKRPRRLWVILAWAPVAVAVLLEFVSRFGVF